MSRMTTNENAPGNKSEDTPEADTTPTAKPASTGKAKSGSRRQPRLADVQALQTTVDRLEGKIEVLESMVTAQAKTYDELIKTIAASPFTGIGLEEVAAFFAMVGHAANPASLGSFSDWKVKGRTATLVRGFKAALTGEDDELIDKPRQRKRPEAGAKTHTVEPIMREPEPTQTATGPKQSTAERLGLTPPPIA